MQHSKVDSSWMVALRDFHRLHYYVFYCRVEPGSSQVGTVSLRLIRRVVECEVVIHFSVTGP